MVSSSRRVEQLAQDAERLEGTMPLASPECTPSFRTRTQRSPPTRPRSDVVTRAGRSCRSPSRGRRRGSACRCGLQAVDVERQVVAAALLAGFDQHDAARVREPLLLQRLDRGQRRERRVAVVGAAAAVRACRPRRPANPGAEPVAPARHLRLLVEVAVQQDRVGDLARDLHEDHRRAALEAHDLDRQALDRLRLGHQSAISSCVAASMWPCFAPVGVEGGDLLGMFEKCNTTFELRKTKSAQRPRPRRRKLLRAAVPAEERLEEAAGVVAAQSVHGGSWRDRWPRADVRPRAGGNGP